MLEFVLCLLGATAFSILAIDMSQFLSSALECDDGAHFRPFSTIFS